MKYVVWGAGVLGRELYYSLSEKSRNNISAFCDNNPKKQGGEIDGKKIFPLKHFKNIHELGFVIAMSGYDMMDAYQMLVKPEYENIKVYAWKDRSRKSNKDFEKIIQSIDRNLPLLEYVETDIVSHCNLKCKHCGHYADQLPPYFVSVDSFRKDTERLADLYSGCVRFRIMGGEPLLHPDLVEIAGIARMNLPMANIRIVSNGLLIPKYNDTKLQKLRDLGIEFDITQYPPTREELDSIKYKMQEHDIRYSVSSLVNEFYDFNRVKPANYIDAYKHCKYPHCHSMLNGYISPCYAGLFSERVAKLFHRNISKMDICKNRINLYDPTLTGDKLNRLLRSPIPACQYCGIDNPPLVPWESNI